MSLLPTDVNASCCDATSKSNAVPVTPLSRTIAVTGALFKLN